MDFLFFQLSFLGQNLGQTILLISLVLLIQLRKYLFSLLLNQQQIRVLRIYPFILLQLVNEIYVSWIQIMSPGFLLKLLQPKNLILKLILYFTLISNLLIHFHLLPLKQSFLLKLLFILLFLITKWFQLLSSISSLLLPLN